MDLVFSIYKMGTISNSNHTELIERLSKMVHMICLIGNKAHKIPNKNYYPQNGGDRFQVILLTTPFHT